jgi:HEAT repeat protein
MLLLFFLLCCVLSGCELRSTDSYIEQLGSGDSDERRKAAMELLRRGPVVLPALIQELESKRSQVRYIVVQVLGKLIEPEAVDALITSLDDRSPEVAGKAAESLAHHGSPLALAALLGYADHTTTLRRSRAIRALGFCHSYEEEPELSDSAHRRIVSALNDTASQVRIAAIEAAREFGFKGAAAPLMQLSRDPAPEVRHVAIQALGQILTGVAPNSEPVGPTTRDRIFAILVDALGEPDFKSIRAKAMRALGQIGDRRAIPHLQRMLGAGDDSDRREAGWALEQLQRVGQAGSAIKG